MTRLPRPTLRALRSIVARAYGVRRSRVRVTDRPGEFGNDDLHRDVIVRVDRPARECWGFTYHAQPDGVRWVCRRVARRARAGDLP